MTAQGDEIRSATVELEAALNQSQTALINTAQERDQLQVALTAEQTAHAITQAALEACQEGHEPPPDPDPDPLVRNAPVLAGVHVLHQFPQAAGASKSQAMNELTAQTPAIRNALAVQGVSAFCMRVPWNIIDNGDYEILDRGRALADEAGKEFTVRFMAGRHTPNRFLTAMPTLTSGGTTFPRPFDANGAANLPFLSAYMDLLTPLSEWCMSNEVRLIHLSHYAKDWAEFYYGPEVQGIMGNTAAGQTAMVQATLGLANVALNVVDPAISLELPMSGHGPVMRAPGSANPGIAERVAMGIASGIGGGSDRFIIQGNGVDNDGLWGAPSEDTEVLMDNVLKANLFFGGQMIQPTNTWTWSAVFDQVQAAKATYLEVYLPSFSGGTNAALKSEAAMAMTANRWRTA